MITYFLNGKGDTPKIATPTTPVAQAIFTTTTAQLQHNESITTQTSNEQGSSCLPLSDSFAEQSNEEQDSLDESINLRHKCLSQKRKSLCRQQNIFHSAISSGPESSLSQSSDTSGTSQTVIDQKSIAATVANKVLKSTNIMESIILGSDIPLTKSQITELKHQSLPLCTKVNLMDSIESLEKFLKNDISLSDFNGRVVPFVSSSTANTTAASTPTATNGRMNMDLAYEPTAQKQNLQKNALNIKRSAVAKNSAARIYELSKSNETINKGGFGTHLRESIKINSKHVLKLSQSLYPIHSQSSKGKIPNSKSLDLLL